MQTPLKNDFKKKVIIAYLSHKRTENARNKKIIFFAIMKPLKADNAKQNTKKGLIPSWKTKTLKRMGKTTSMHLLH
ncbi:type I restriction endonuclease subunit M [Helicobacter pylori]|uniref:type I restriction endonuclease subunit M n=1 Tax=Helicobacter pylori TaxID=210 RepID=UPI000FDF52DD|nr:type I restriction endonuclease subunit M [Helicobacter pylori]RVZ15117.1 type I restriction endonuclease subunit M [Helicobacter pylori]